MFFLSTSQASIQTSSPTQSFLPALITKGRKCPHCPAILTWLWRIPGCSDAGRPSWRGRGWDRLAQTRGLKCTWVSLTQKQAQSCQGSTQRPLKRHKAQCYFSASKPCVASAMGESGVTLAANTCHTITSFVTLAKSQSLIFIICRVSLTKVLVCDVQEEVRIEGVEGVPAGETAQ